MLGLELFVESKAAVHAALIVVEALSIVAAVVHGSKCVDIARSVHHVQQGQCVAIAISIVHEGIHWRLAVVVAVRAAVVATGKNRVVVVEWI